MALASTAEADPAAISPCDAQQSGTPEAGPETGEVQLPESGLSIALPAPDDCTIAPEVPRPPGPDIFGSVALAVASTPLDARWHDIRAQTISPADDPWAALLEQAAAQDRRARLQLVNNWVNARLAFAEDRSADHWAAARESIPNGRGDCEDYAIAKMQLLEQAGVPSDDLYFVIVRDLLRQADHAVLAVREPGGLVVLDSKTDRILSAEVITDYRPILSYSADFAWAHGYRSGAAGHATRGRSFSAASRR